jgi:putative transposase
LARSNVYYDPVAESEEDLRLKRLIDEEYTRHPFYGVRRIHTWLTWDRDEVVNRKRVYRLMREMGLGAIFPRPHLSIPGQAHKIYPYLLKGLRIDRPDQVWATDITYIRLVHGFVYLVAIMDWFSRYVSSWELSVTMDAGFCVGALNAAVRAGTPDIFNTDQGRSSPGLILRSGSWQRESKSVWTDGVGCSTTFSWNGCGGQ